MIYSLSQVLVTIGNDKKHPLSRVFLGNLPETILKNTPFFLENMGTCMQPPYAFEGGGGGAGSSGMLGEGLLVVSPSSVPPPPHPTQPLFNANLVQVCWIHSWVVAGQKWPNFFLLVTILPHSPPPPPPPPPKDSWYTPGVIQQFLLPQMIVVKYLLRVLFQDSTVVSVCITLSQFINYWEPIVVILFTPSVQCIINYVNSRK